MPQPSRPPALFKSARVPAFLRTLLGLNDPNVAARIQVTRGRAVLAVTGVRNHPFYQGLAAADVGGFEDDDEDDPAYVLVYEFHVGDGGRAGDDAPHNGNAGDGAAPPEPGWMRVGAVPADGSAFAFEAGGEAFLARRTPGGYLEVRREEPTTGHPPMEGGAPA